jgi:sugar phosphate isomerase/epimerase
MRDTVEERQTAVAGHRSLQIPNAGVVTMKYGAMNFPIRPFLQELESIAGLGFDYFELTLDPPQAHYSMVLAQKRELLDSLKRLDMELVCHLPTFLSTADLNESLRKTSLAEMMASLEVAAGLGPLKVVVHPSYITGLGVFVSDQCKQYAMNSLAALMERADRLGVCLCLENMFPRTNYLSNPEDFSEIFHRFPTLKLTLDTGHANIGGHGGKRTVDFLDRFSERIFHVHASDNFGKEDNHLPVGTGTVDFAKIVKRLKAGGYDETITLEVFSRDRDYLRISREKLAGMFMQPGATEQ